MWDEIIAYSREAAKVSTVEELEPLTRAQVETARRLLGAHTDAMKSLLLRATRSDDILTFSIGCMLAVRLGLPSAEQWLDEASWRLANGEQRMRPHPVPVADGETTEEAALRAIRLLREEGEPPS